MLANIYILYSSEPFKFIQFLFLLDLSIYILSLLGEGVSNAFVWGKKKQPFIYIKILLVVMEEG